MRRIRRLRRPRGVLLAALAAAALAFPLGVLASHQFTDVPDSNPFHADIDAIADAGVTTGCGGGKYCPSANVTRAEMAAFMNRLGALQAGKTPVVNANTSRSTDGWSIGCPTGTALSGGLCFDTTTRSSANIFDASDACANLGGGLFGSGQIWKLAQALELRAAHANGDITISAAEWSSTTWYDDANTFEGMAIEGLGMSHHSTLAVLPYRCAAIPLSRNPLIIIPFSEPQDGSDPGPAGKGSKGTITENGSSK